MAIEQVDGSENTFRITADALTGGWSTRSYPTQIGDDKLYIADNVVYNRDGVVSKRPGNGPYGTSAIGGAKVGSGLPILAMTRFYPSSGAPILVVHSGTQLWQGNDATGVFTVIAGITLSNVTPARFTPMYDPDMSSGAATALFITDGVHQPQIWDGVNVATAATGGTGLPLGRAGNPLTPLYTCNWDYHMVYAGQPDEPSGLYISDALRPESFTGVNYIASNLSSYVAYFPAGRDGTLGAIVGIVPLNANLLIFYQNGVIVATNTGTYGATQYLFTRLSSIVGATAPRSIVAMDTAVFWFGGDRFYATDSNTIAPLADDLPSLYSHTSRAIAPPEISNATTVVGLRRGSQYWASYDSLTGGLLSRVAVFDTAANGGWSFPSTAVVTSSNFVEGGAWSRWPTGMPVGCGIECRSAADAATLPMFWGSSQADVVSQHDPPAGIFTDNLAGGTFNIGMQLQTKSFYLDKPLSPKTLQGAYMVCVFTSQASVFEDYFINPYAIEDNGTATALQVQYEVVPVGATYGGGAKYGQGVLYQGSVQSTLVPLKFQPIQLGPTTSIGLGFTENSNQPLSVVAFVLEVTVDPIAP